MEQSPLTQQPRPEAFQPKIVQLYDAVLRLLSSLTVEEVRVHVVQELTWSPRGAVPHCSITMRTVDYRDEDESEKTEGFWREFFLLKPDQTALRTILDGLGPGDLLHIELQTRELFTRAVSNLRTTHGVADLHALDTLKTFLAAVLAKKYMNPSSDIINVLAGLDHVDTVFSDFVGALDAIIRNGRSLDLREKAIEVALAVTSGAYQTSLLTYFIQRDLFPAVMKVGNPQRRLRFIQDSDGPARIFQPFTLLGLLANYNKFEFQNPYQLRLADFVNEATIQKIIQSTGYTCQRLRQQFVDVQDDIPEGWTLSSTLNMIGLGAIAPGGKPPPKQVYDAEASKQMFASLPGQEAALLLAAYDFIHANKLFCFNFVTLPAEKGEEQPFSAYISLTSYLLQHAHLSPRATLYTHLNLTVFRLLIEDPVLCKRMCSGEADATTAVRLARQRQPYLPLVRGERVVATAVMDVMIDGINHNLRRRLDVRLYTLCVGILLRIISYMSRSRTRLAYHWHELFRSLLGLVKFMTSYAADLRDLPHVETLLDHVVNLLALALSSGEAFLPGPAAYDDLFYKVVEMGETLVKFRDTYNLSNRPSNSIDTLVNVSTHYKEMLLANGGGEKKVGKKGNLTSLQVAEVIKQGYETLSIQTKEGLDSWEKYREADERTLLKKMARAAVGDVQGIVGGGKQA
ncbi:DUF1741-domain-containing protein [Coniochaeta ligniaria NRRL 30616]|uniref:DUF1741-domain-containing protein n=1 Tax=Coniochaeta ligniaria NRRL 30616 TaxID=1408157 RepID=A0A1J7IXF0_9PEZI|nr:DUF1741-domain-containing protein [Coniochaeta ligniaria NRRL 30616]